MAYPTRPYDQVCKQLDLLAQRLDAMDRRLSGLEQGRSHVVPQRMDSVATDLAPHPLQPPPLPPMLPHVEAFPPALPSSSQARADIADALVAYPAPRVSASAPPRASAPPTSPGHPPIQPNASARTDRWSLEQLIGGRIFAIAGSLIVAVGMLLLIKLGVDRGWFSIAPWARCTGFVLLGLAMVGAGDVIRRRLDDPAAGTIRTLAGAGLAAAGLATIYGATFAAFSMYDLFGREVAFVLLAVICAFGIAVALRASSLALAILALIGAFLSPVLLADGGSSPLVVPIYTSVLFLGSWLLASFRPSPFRQLRLVAWILTLLLGTLWFVEDGRVFPFITIGYVVTIWAIVQGGLVLSGMRLAEASATPGSAANAARRLAQPITLSFSSSIWAVALGIIALQLSALGDAAWLVPAGLGIACLLLATMLAGGLAILSEPAETDLQRLGVGLWAQAGGFLIVALAIGLGGWMQSVSWMALGVAGVVAGSLLRSRHIERYGVLLLLIAMARALTWDAYKHSNSLHEIFYLNISHWTALMALAGLSWIVASEVIRRVTARDTDRPSRIRPVVSDLLLFGGLSAAVCGFIHSSNSEIANFSLLVPWTLVLIAAAFLRRWHLTQFMASLAVLLASALCTLLALSYWQVQDHLVLGPWKLTAPGRLLLVMLLPLAAGLTLLRSATDASGRVFRGLLFVTAIVLFMLAPMSSAAELGPVTFWWLAAAVLVIGVNEFRLIRETKLVLCSAALILCASTCLWAVAFASTLYWRSVQEPIFLHPAFWSGMFISGLFALCAWRASSQARALAMQFYPTVCFAAALMTALIASSAEIARVAAKLFPAAAVGQAAAVTIWWGLFAVALLVLGFARRVPIVRHAGLGLMIIAAAKAVVVDLATVDAAWRVASFIALGALMLGIAAGYAKVSKTLSKPPVP